MKIIILGIISIFASHLYAQQAEGKLFFLLDNQVHNTGSIGYVSYPDTQIVQIDSAKLSHFAHTEKGLFATTGSLFADSGQIIRYDLNTFEADTVLDQVPAYRVAVWNNYLLSLNAKAPHLRVYDIAQQYLPVFELDTTKLPFAGVEMAVSGNKLFIHTTFSIAIIDLVQQDTLAIVDFEPPLFRSVTMLMGLVPLGDKVYFDLNYATGAIRASLMSIDTADFSIDTSFHAEGYVNYFPPVPSANKLYIYSYPSYYDFAQDSLITFTHTPWDNEVIAYDVESSTAFTISGSFRNISHYFNDSLLSMVQLSDGLRQAQFVAESSTNSIENGLGHTLSMSLYPNPADKYLIVAFSAPIQTDVIQIRDMQGKLVYENATTFYGSRFEVDISKLASGRIYTRVSSQRRENSAEIY